MDIIILPLLFVINTVLTLYWWAVFIYVIFNLLITFDVINRYNPAVYNTQAFLFRIVEPALDRIRRFLPSINGLDFSPLALLLAITFIEKILNLLCLKFV